MNKISVVFCGGCNPCIDRWKVAFKLKKKLEGKGYEVVFNTLFANYIIFLSGCNCNCAYKTKAIILPHAIIAGNTLNFFACEEDNIIEEITEDVEKYL